VIRRNIIENNICGAWRMSKKQRTALRFSEKSRRRAALCRRRQSKAGESERLLDIRKAEESEIRVAVVGTYLFKTERVSEDSTASSSPASGDSKSRRQTKSTSKEKQDEYGNYGRLVGTPDEASFESLLRGKTLVVKPRNKYVHHIPQFRETSDAKF